MISPRCELTRLAVTVGGMLLAWSCGPEAGSGSFLTQRAANESKLIRTVEPLLSMAQAYRPCQRVCTDARSVCTAVCADEVEPRLSSTEAPARVTSHGIAQAQALAEVLRTGTDEELDLEIGRLEELAYDQASPQLANHLASAYIVRAQRLDRPTDLIRAWEAALLAQDLDDTALEPLFNQALACQLLGLDACARRAADRFLGRDAGSAWSRELGARRGCSSDCEPADATRDGSSLLSAQTDDSPADILAQALDRDLVAWATAVAAEDASEAAAALGRARIRAEALSHRGDTMLAESLAIIESLTRSAEGSIRHWHIVEGLLAYAAAQADDTENPEADLGRAVAALAKANLPIGRWIEVDRLAVIGYLDGKYDRVVGRLGRLREHSSSTHHLLHARALSIMAACHASQTRHLEAITEYEHAERQYQAIEEGQGVIRVRIRHAELLGLIGLVKASWRQRIHVLRKIDTLQTPDRHFVLNETSVAIRSLGFARMALEIHKDAVDAAFATGDPLLVSIALRYFGDLLLEVGDQAGARGVLEQARVFATAIEKEGPRRSIELMIEELDGRVALRSDPRRAIDAFSRAIDLATELAYPQPEASLHAQRAEAHLAIGNVGAAREDLRKAVAATERSWQLALDATSDGARVQGQELWNRYLSVGRPFFDQLVRLLIAEGQNDEAFAVAERARARELLELVDKESSERRALLHSAENPLHTLQLVLPSGAVLLAYWLLEDRLIYWRVASRSVVTGSVEIDRRALERRTAALLRGVTTGAAEHRLRGHLEWLHRRLIEPVGPIDSESLVVVVPDGVLHGVPFAALLDDRGFLIERNPIAIVPSATVAAAIWQANRMRRGRAKPSVLALSPRHDLKLYDGRTLPKLALLDGAAREAVNIVSLYRDGTALSGEQATFGALREQVAGRTVIHFAGHAVGTPKTTYLVLAPDDRSPTGALYPQDLFELSLAATRVVVLSACSSAGGHPIGALGVSRLVRPLLGAGVSAVVGSLWEVPDGATPELMTAFHQALSAGVEAAEALRSAQLHMLADPVASQNSIAAWAPFQVVGSARLSPQPEGEP